MPDSKSDWLERGEFPENDLEKLRALEDFQEADSRPARQILGYPSLIRGDYMDLQCPLASHGIDGGDDQGFKAPRADQ